VKTKLFILTAAAFLVVSQLAAQDSTLVEETVYQNKVLFLPALGSTPETGFLFGAVVVPQFKLSGAGEDTRSSGVLFSGIYTSKSQILLSIAPDIILPEEAWIINGNYFVNYFPNSYWGVGPKSRESDEINVLFTEISVEQTVLKQVSRGIFTGPYIRLNKVYNLSFEDRDGVSLPAQDVPGAAGSISSGVGWMSRWDLRNSNMTPTQNHFIQFSFLVNSSLLGSTDQYTSYQLDARKYVDLKQDGRSVLAFQWLYRSLTGNPPFLEMSELGGDRIGRGYYAGRYRDLNALQFQSELRQSIKGRFGFTVFGAMGEVWHRYEDFNVSPVKWSTGAGFRFNINKHDPTNIRIDYGIGKGTSGFYIQFGEAF
jgi:outer membrane protein assembly factor BamA